MIFAKNDKIKCDGKFYAAICVDQDIAVFAPIKRIKKDNCTRISYTKGMFAVSNSKEFEEIFKYERVRDDEI